MDGFPAARRRDALRIYAFANLYASIKISLCTEASDSPPLALGVGNICKPGDDERRKPLCGLNRSDGHRKPPVNTHAAICKLSPLEIFGRGSTKITPL